MGSLKFIINNISKIAYFKHCKKQLDLIKYKFKISIILKHFISKEENEKNI